MTTKDSLIRHLRLPVLGVLLGVVALFAGRTLAQGGSPTSIPQLGELRAAPNVHALPAQPRLESAELAATADAVGVVRVTGVHKAVDAEWTSDTTGLTNRWGHGEVTAAVQRTIVGQASDLSRFAFSAIYVPGTTEFAVPASNPPLEVGQEYLVFLKDGKVYFPGGTYRVHGGKVWAIDHWDGPDSQSYPDDLSGMTVEAASQAISATR